MYRYLLLTFLFLVSYEGQGKKTPGPAGEGLPLLLDGSQLPGVVPVMGNYLFMARTEVSNLQYREFLYWLKEHDTAAYQRNYPDMGVWGKGQESKAVGYFTQAAWQDYPLVGVSHRQAEAFCLWLHDRLSQYFKLRKIPVHAFRVRLPNEKEWMHAARGGQGEEAVYPWPHTGIRYSGNKKKNRGKLLLNCRLGMLADASSAPYNGPGSSTVQTRSYWANAYGLYNMSGNVSEWLYEDGRHMGGSWKTPPYDCRINGAALRSEGGPASDIGFRYVIEILSVNDPEPLRAFHFDKQFSRLFCYIPVRSAVYSSFFMSQEVSNLWYRQFLLERPDSAFAIPKGLWKPFFPYPWFDQYGSHSAFSHYPVSGISHRAALAFCKWLNEKYAEAGHKPYRKVIFTLPDENEWEFAATFGYKRTYPWGGPYTRNSRGCYLANFAPEDERFLYLDNLGRMNRHTEADTIRAMAADGALIPSQVTSYFPNDLGLYNMSGNVAEMLLEAGVCKGGSWHSSAYEMMIVSRSKYEAADAGIGFRVLARVLEK